MSSPFLVSVSAASKVSVSGYMIGQDRVHTSRPWSGVIGEVVAFNSKLSIMTEKKWRATCPTSGD